MQKKNKVVSAFKLQSCKGLTQFPKLLINLCSLKKNIKLVRGQ